MYRLYYLQKKKGQSTPFISVGSGVGAKLCCLCEHYLMFVLCILLSNVELTNLAPASVGLFRIIILIGLHSHTHTHTHLTTLMV